MVYRNRLTFYSDQTNSHSSKNNCKNDRINEIISDGDASFQCDASPYKGFMKGARQVIHMVCVCNKEDRGTSAARVFSQLFLCRCRFNWVSIMFLFHLLQREALMVFLLSGFSISVFFLLSLFEMLRVCIVT